MLTSTHPFFSNFPNWVIGHDRLFQEMLRVVDDVAYPSSSGSNYPPHDIIREGSNEYIIELAVAGFEKDDLQIRTEDGRLFIGGNKKEQVDNQKIVHKGIAKRSFEKVFHLAENVVVRDTSFVNGIITIKLEQVVPDERKPKFFEL
jgi:molecular chaperone IbpA